MKRYRLLKDLPNLKKGTIFSENNPFFGAKILVTKTKDAGINFITNEIFEKFFEEIQEEPTDSIHWKPLPGDIYWYLSNTGVVLKKQWMSYPDDIRRHRIGNTYRTEKECEKACNRKLAEARLRRTSTFKPDFKNGNGGWIIGYNYYYGELACVDIDCADYGEIVRYETEEDAQKSIKENREDWLIYFGIDPSDNEKQPEAAAEQKGFWWEK